MPTANPLRVFAQLIIFVFTITNAFRIFDIDGKETILASENENISIQCKSDFPMTYCGFVHPSGKRFSFTDRTVNDGKCAQKIKATKSDSGEWGCHIGTKSVRLETIKKIQVRIVNQVAALETNVTAKLGRPITIACATTKGLIPLSYCRFEPPNGRSFNIDPSVTENSSILGKYYFPSNASLDRGDCAVTIIKVKYDDVGLWTCGAGLDDGKEHIDVIKLEVEGMYKMSTASATGVTLGGILIAVALGSLGYVAWKKRRFLGGTHPEPEVIEIQEMARQSSDSQSPMPERSLPAIVIQSPSTPGEPGTSPLMSRSQSPT
ncbi:jg17150 [Pararge aegeria aegeria]|uniref:Jg17150 protein n=1 Tax=Pararge aegeria aegeria TaxID=348720 RepID=A0A8S4RP65_9NEOP|nr:jg17150 [Pararge aegeria aegeria]